jgi:hypothetical protein
VARQERKAALPVAAREQLASQRARAARKIPVTV